MDALIGWIGGKRLLRKTISQYVPNDIQGYIEPFGGAAWMLLFKERWADLEVYNDLDYRLVNLFLQVKYHPDELIKELDWLVASRKLFGDILKQEGLTEIQRSAL
ncbi:MAG: DNA adenine methylase [Candidatus Cloacimonetes bacterium]|jgi:DNA adenine methylase|nr:DNA adenine methylase [Candidatus Cloacimonadota bacterium]